MIDFLDIGYLETGSESQRKAFTVLSESRVLERLCEFDPVLIGTFPIGIAVESSDLDVACHFGDKSEFILKLQSEFSDFAQFGIRDFVLDGLETVVCNFVFSGFEFEIFGQPIAVTSQMGYRHMVVEHRILLEKGEDFRNEIIGLKNSGLKTEPAFAVLLGILGDPYLGLLDFEV
ncbi:DUF4269 domain-containing protein [Flavobacterium sp.]|uniref:DUF4269 domain-containing protein n=1 Tax=Flavobacterium sp. TaxID=239 RepID=UPI0011FB7829|nr:DUF4269 domain-containing protein [Flavobacterium sp.]RZJ72308.1 MAG: DUF4269 domain-containing protein [Flavobacterium sp.]